MGYHSTNLRDRLYFELVVYFQNNALDLRHHPRLLDSAVDSYLIEFAQLATSEKGILTII